MSRDKRVYDDDDGRTVADMSQVSRPALFGRMPESHKKTPRERPEEPQDRPDRPWEDHSMSRSERWAVIWGAWKASILIAGVYLVAFGLFIWLLVTLLT
jgi:hypothetical protein